MDPSEARHRVARRFAEAPVQGRVTKPLVFKNSKMNCTTLKTKVLEGTGMVRGSDLKMMLQMKQKQRSCLGPMTLGQPNKFHEQAWDLEVTRCLVLTVAAIK